MSLIVLFIYFTLSVCGNQIVRFLNGPIVVSLEKDYRNWVYDPMAITICTDYLNEDAMNRLVEQYTETDEDCYPESYEFYRRFFNVIGLLNPENIHLLSEFQDEPQILNFTGDELRIIAKEVCLNFNGL